MAAVAQLAAHRTCWGGGLALPLPIVAATAAAAFDVGIVIAVWQSPCTNGWTPLPV